ncbi:hypothetical protein T03_16940 [Trichinella britovi]|uniref:Uncharacterized protein n=1 Tax=Trichinella britovi TaxID=45882 RepID=A0A0V1C5Z1_TRIBR|nr:hypothetical protein T03_16940 [Trichinella britovi]
MPFTKVRTSPSLDRPSVAFRLGSSTLPNLTLWNTGNTDNQYCNHVFLTNFSQSARPLVPLSYNN